MDPRKPPHTSAAIRLGTPDPAGRADARHVHTGIPSISSRGSRPIAARHSPRHAAWSARAHVEGSNFEAAARQNWLCRRRQTADDPICNHAATMRIQSNASRRHAKLPDVEEWRWIAKIDVALRSRPAKGSTAFTRSVRIFGERGGVETRDDLYWTADQNETSTEFPSAGQTEFPSAHQTRTRTKLFQEENHDVVLAGAGGIEPPNGGIKIRCLTAWLRPNWPGTAASRGAASDTAGL